MNFAKWICFPLSALSKNGPKYVEVILSDSYIWMNVFTSMWNLFFFCKSVGGKSQVIRQRRKLAALWCDFPFPDGPVPRVEDITFCSHIAEIGGEMGGAFWLYSAVG